jgi:hypothetical protein
MATSAALVATFVIMTNPKSLSGQYIAIARFISLEPVWVIAGSGAHSLFSLNLVPKPRTLSVRAVYVLSSLHITQKPVTARTKPSPKRTVVGVDPTVVSTLSTPCEHASAM